MHNKVIKRQTRSQTDSQHGRPFVLASRSLDLRCINEERKCLPTPKGITYVWFWAGTHVADVYALASAELISEKQGIGP